LLRRRWFFQALLDSVTLLGQNLHIHEIASGVRLSSLCTRTLFRLPNHNQKANQMFSRGLFTARARAPD
jgi:hypothetical protein